MQPGASRRAPVTGPAVRRRAAPTAPVPPGHPAADAATPQSVVLDLFGALNSIMVTASNRALRLSGADRAAHAPAEFEQEAFNLNAELATVVQLAAEAARTRKLETSLDEVKKVLQDQQRKRLDNQSPDR